MIPPVIHQRFLHPHSIQKITPMTPGMSGSQVYRCDGDEAFVLRRHPDSTSINRVQEIHTLMHAAASHCSLIPTYARDSITQQTVVVGPHNDLWELMQWKSGSPLPASATLEQMRTGAVAIAQVHQAMEVARPHSLTSQSIHAVPPSITERIDRIRFLNEALMRPLSRDVHGHVDPVIQHPLCEAQRLLALRWASISDQMSTRLNQMRETTFPVHYVLRDVHREHILFRGSRVTAVIDFDALRIDTPAADLARWIGGFDAFLDSPDRAIDEVLAGYFSVQPLRNTLGEQESANRLVMERKIALGKTSDSPPDFRKLVRLIVESSTWISLANWVVWLLAESREFADLQRVAERLSRLVTTAETL